MIIKSFYELKNYELIKEIDMNNRDIRLYKFQEIEISGTSVYYPNVLLKQFSDNHLILPTKEMTMSLNKKSYYEENGMIFNYKDIDLSKINQLNPKDSIELGNKNIILEPVYFFIYNTENYFHFIYDTLPYLYSFLQLRKTNPKIKLLMNFINKNKNDFIPFVIEALELLDITRDDIIIHNTNNIYNKLYLSSSLTHNGLSNSPPRKEIFEIYDLMIKNSRLKYEIGIKKLNLKKIYISRRTWTNKSNLKNIGTNYTNRRKLMNEDDLVELLKKENFNEIFGENFSFLEKVILFNNAEEVIGSIGGTIVNCVFCNKNCRITCLVSPDFLRVNKRIKFSLVNKNIKYFEDTYLDTENNKIPPNVRIEIINGKYKGFLGEIVKYENENKYLIKLGDGRNIGWSNNEKYNKIILSDDNFKQLDFGLNSPWYIYLKKFLDFKVSMI